MSSERWMSYVKHFLHIRHWVSVDVVHCPFKPDPCSLTTEHRAFPSLVHIRSHTYSELEYTRLPTHLHVVFVLESNIRLMRRWYRKLDSYWWSSRPRSSSVPLGRGGGRQQIFSLDELQSGGKKNHPSMGTFLRRKGKWRRMRITPLIDSTMTDTHLWNPSSD